MCGCFFDEYLRVRLNLNLLVLIKKEYFNSNFKPYKHEGSRIVSNGVGISQLKCQDLHSISS